MAILSRSAARVGWILVGCGLGSGRGAEAQARPHEYQVKAAYLFNFLSYVQWPGEPASRTQPITLCVLGGDPFGDILTRAVRGRRSQGREVRVTPVGRTVEVDRCDVGFIPAEASPPPAAWLEKLDGRPVLTVGEGRDFAMQGGMIAFVVEDETVRFDVNLASARASGLQLSSRLVRLALRQHD